MYLNHKTHSYERHKTSVQFRRFQEQHPRIAIVRHYGRHRGVWCGISRNMCPYGERSFPYSVCEVQSQLEERLVSRLFAQGWPASHRSTASPWCQHGDRLILQTAKQKTRMFESQKERKGGNQNREDRCKWNCKMVWKGVKLNTLEGEQVQQ